METETYFAEIPGTLGYAVSTDGVVYGPDEEPRNEYVNGDGYKTVSVQLLDGRYRTFGVHRLVALAHLPIPEGKDVTQLTVNHIDGDKTNNDVNNLEWVSVYLNNLHASLIRRQVENPTLIHTDPEGRKSFIDNLHDAAALLSVDLDLAWAMVRDGLVYEGSRLEAFVRDTKIPEELQKERIGVRNHLGQAVEVRVSVKDVETGLVEHFGSMADAAKYFDVSPSHIHQCVSSEKKTRLFKKRYLIVREFDQFPDLDPDQYQRLQNPGGRDTVVYIKSTKHMVIFPSAGSMISMFDLSKKAVTERLRKHGVGEIGDYIFAYMSNMKQFQDRVANSSSS
jgi:hypothetical protein